MRLIRSVALFVGIFMVLSLALAVKAYENRQDNMVLEGNSLLSGQALQVVMDPSPMAIDPDFPDETWFILPIGGDPKTRGIVFTESASPYFPIYSGRQLAGKPDGTCLAGSQVPVTKMGNETFYSSETLRCHVVGRLGTSAASLLQEDLIYATPATQIPPETPKIWVDGPGVDGAMGTSGEYGQVTPVASGVSSRTNIDLVSPLFVLMGTGTALLGAVLVGALPAEGASASIRVFHIVGISQRRIFGRWLATFTLAYFAALVLATLFWRPVLRAETGWADLVRLIPFSALLAGVFVVTMTVRIRRASRWSF